MLNAQNCELESDLVSKKTNVILLRWLLIISTSCLILFSQTRDSDSTSSYLFIGALIVSNLCFYFFPIVWFAQRYFDSILVFIDIVLISWGIWFAGQVDSDFYLLYFLVIMMASVSHNMLSILFSAVLCSIVYLFMNYFAQKHGIFSTEILIRIPFFFVVAIFYGHLVILVRKQKRMNENVRGELDYAVQLREHSNQLASVLDRNIILDILIKSVQKLTNSPVVFVFSRNAQKILSASIPPEHIAVVKKICSQIEFSTDRVEVDGFTFFPVNGDTNSDLYIGVNGEMKEELVEYLRSLLSSAAMALNNSGQYQALIHEVENRKQVVLQLSQALEFKSEFLASVSHELRTPLYCMMGFAELMVEGGYGSITSEQEKIIYRILENGKDLLGHINNILDYSKLEAGGIKTKLEPGILGQFVFEIAEYCKPLIRDKSVSIEVIDRSNGESVITDWGILRHVLINLVSNAVKFTEKGFVKVEVSIDNILKQLVLVVADTGVGIDSKYFTEIFVAFRQIDGGYTRKYAGTGLGLAICKKQIEMLQGSIIVSSTPGVGSEFTVKIPISSELNLSC